ncbi:MAG TPA: asparagine synthase (glutamine-hydrolyzing) [Gemmatimonadaceae bacterium]|nr:asparagine synthase (glutamine-hydrolyzing) [Gemmatimonadaceae bacterium]
MQRMTCALQHRGPDGHGLWASEDGQAILGHRRLSIIDLRSGAQPMTGGDARCAITFNGEIYNYRELRRDLEARGITLSTQSDTEVLLRLYELEGEAALARCTGMFAFAIWDGRKNRLVLARDRLGKKPLYIAQQDGVVYFASSLGALRTVLVGSLEIDLAALDDFLSLGFIPAPRTIFQGIEKLESATILSIDGRTSHRTRYWSPATAVSSVPAGTPGLEELDAQLSRAVSVRLRSDVPLGIFLSGGIDSSLVTAYAAREVAGIRTFSIAFGEDGYDEQAFAERVSRTLGTEHTSLRVREGLLDLLPSLVRHAGEPFADASALPLWVLARDARAAVTVALGGDGGDEGFGGYPWYRLHRRLERHRALVPRFMAQAGVRALGAVPSGASGVRAAAGRAQRALAVLAQPSSALRYGALRVQVSESDTRRWYAPRLREARREFVSAQERIARAYLESSGDSLRRMRAADLLVHLADGLMPKSDLATMAHGLELRSPLLDHDVVALGLAMNAPLLEDGQGGKRPLRTLLARFLPDDLVQRPKQGFVVPLARWFREGLRSRVEALPGSDVLREAAWFEPEGIRRLVAEHLGQERDHTQRLFNLVVLEEWLRQQ